MKKRLHYPLMFLFAAATLLLLGTAVKGQETADVIEIKSVLSRDAVHPGKTIKAAVILKIQPGYHINDNAPLDEFMFPTTLAFKDHPSFEILEIYYPAGHAGRFEYSDTELIVYEGETVLGALIKAKDDLASGPVKLDGSLSYQACDNVSCLPPKEITFEVSIDIATASQKTEERHPELFEKIPFKTLK